MGFGMGLCAAKKTNKVDNLQDDLFAFKINYNDADTATDLFNGNISETYWKTSTDNVKRKYDYKYDDLNRLLQADYSKQANTTFNSYLEHLSYDKNGNIKTLKRNGGMDTDGIQPVNPIDNLTYLYDSNNKNLLLKVTDATNSPQGFKDGTNITDDYKYDANGNMIIDNNKGITQIKYNHLNLPTEIFFGSFRISYLYNAVGQKVNKKVFQGRVITTTDYLSGFQYKNLFLQFFPHAEGYVNATKIGTGYTFKHVFNYTDHLGNIRLSYSDTNNNNSISPGEVLEENHYYPFGLKHSGYNTNNLQPSYKYKFNGKEYQDELGLNMYDYGARNYDAALGRWMNIDNLSEKFYPVSPYIYAINNPVYFIDPDGNEIKIGENIYAYKKDRDYNEYAEGFERDAYMALDNLYSSGAMNVTFGEGDNAKTVNVLDEMINSTDYTVSIEEGTNKNPHNFLHNKDNNTSAKILFRGDVGSGFLKDANGKWEESNFGFNSPAGNLAHEIMHGYSKFNDKDFQSRWDDKSTQGQILFRDSQGSEDLSFPNREEQYNTTMTNQVLTKLGEDTRTNYGANPVSTQGVNSNKPRR